MKIQHLLYGFVVFLASCAPTRRAAPPPPQHPHYLRALSNLRAARWMLEHRPGDWVQTLDEEQAINRIDAAINEIKQASIWDGKNINDHPPATQVSGQPGRLHAALDYLREARQEISFEEDNGAAQGLQGRAYQHIDGAIGSIRHALHS
jgi:hypothetical protein